MKKNLLWVFALAACTAFAPAILTAEPASCVESQFKGQQDAQSAHDSSGWFIGGLGAGFLFSLLGTGVTALVANSSFPMPQMLPSEKDFDIPCYANGYQMQARAKDVGSVWTGGLIGSGVGLVIVVGVIVMIVGPPPFLQF
jgi:hypothetical protein